MDVYKLKNLSDDDRKTVLVGESTEAKEEAYMRPLTDDEIGVKQTELVKTSLLKSAIEEELSEVKKSFKLKLDPLNKELNLLLDQLRVKMIEVKGMVYKLPDHDNSMIHYVDEKGQVLSSRPMLPEERQYRISLIDQQHFNSIHHEQRTGTNED